MTRKGFTILEVLLVVVAVGILLTAVISAIDPVNRLRRSRDQQREVDIQVLQSALIQYESMTESEIPGITDSPKEILRPDAPESCDTASTYIDMNEPQISSLVRTIPVDPQAENEECGSGYFVSRIGQSFIVAAPSAETKTVTISNASGVIAFGGAVSTLQQDGQTYRVHTFTEVGESSLEVIQGGEVDLLIVGGGGGGGGGVGGVYWGTGGGGGEVIVSSDVEAIVQTHAVNVGDGGVSATLGNQFGNPGESSSVLGIIAAGGLGGGGTGGVGGASGSGQSGGVGTTTTSPNRGGGGGGGDQGSGSNGGACGGNGGIGLNVSDTFGTNVGESGYFGGGGGGFNGDVGCAGSGGLGGGASPTSGSALVRSGLANTGGGAAERGGSGGSGIVIVRYAI